MSIVRILVCHFSQASWCSIKERGHFWAKSQFSGTYQLGRVFQILWWLLQPRCLSHLPLCCLQKKGLCFTSVQPRNHHPVPKTAHVALLLLQSPVMGLLSFCIWAARGVKLDLFRISHRGVSRLSLSGLSLLECSHPSSSHPTLLALSSLVFKLGSAHSSVTGLFLLCKVGLNLAPNLLSASQAEAMGSGQLDYKPNTPATLFEEINTDWEAGLGD